MKLLLLCAILAVIAVSAWVVLLPRVVAGTIRSRTGFDVKVEHLSVNPLGANVEIRGLVLGNPEGWPHRDFVRLREFKADARLWSLFGDRLEADEVVLDIERVTLVRNERGVLNAVHFKDGLAPAPGEPEGPKAREGGKSGTSFLIRRLVVRLDHITYADHSGRRPSVKEYPVNISRELADVDSVAKLISPLYTANVAVVTEALGGMFKESVEVLRNTTGALKDAGQKAGDAVKGLLEKLKPKN